MRDGATVPRHEPRRRISQVAATYGLHSQTLRMYEREGLLQPTRSRGNTRLYSRDDLRRLERILELTRHRRINLAGVKMILGLEQRIRELEEQVR